MCFFFQNTDKKVIAQPRTRVMPEAVVALRNKLTQHEMAPVPHTVESLTEEAATASGTAMGQNHDEDSDMYSSPIKVCE